MVKKMRPMVSLGAWRSVFDMTYELEASFATLVDERLKPMPDVRLRVVNAQRMSW